MKATPEKPEAASASAFLTLMAQAVRFGAVGVINTLVDLGVFALLNTVAGLAYVPAHVCSYGSGMVCSFALNRLWTFKVRSPVKPREIVLFIVVNLCAWGLSLLAIAALVEYAGFQPFWAKASSIVVSMTVGFTGNRFLVFREEKA